MIWLKVCQSCFLSLIYRRNNSTLVLGVSCFQWNISLLLAKKGVSAKSNIWENRVWSFQIHLINHWLKIETWNFLQILRIWSSFHGLWECHYFQVFYILSRTYLIMTILSPLHTPFWSKLTPFWPLCYRCTSYIPLFDLSELKVKKTLLG